MEILWALVIIGGPGLLGLALAYGAYEYLMRDRGADRASDRAARELRKELNHEDA